MRMQHKCAVAAVFGIIFFSLSMPTTYHKHQTASTSTAIAAATAVLAGVILGPQQPPPQPQQQSQSQQQQQQQLLQQQSILPFGDIVFSRLASENEDSKSATTTASATTTQLDGFPTMQSIEHLLSNFSVAGAVEEFQSVASLFLSDEMVVLLQMPEFAEVAALLVDKMKLREKLKMGLATRPYLNFPYNENDELKAMAVLMPFMMLPYLFRGEKGKSSAVAVNSGFSQQRYGNSLYLPLDAPPVPPPLPPHLARQVPGYPMWFERNVPHASPATDNNNSP